MRPAAALLGLFLAGCGESLPSGPDVVARIGRQELHYARFEAYLDQAVGESDTVLANDALNGLFDQFLDEELLQRLARERKLVPAGSFSQADRQPTRAALEVLLRGAGQGEPDERAVAAYYAEHREEFRRPERIRLRQILVEDRKQAEQVLVRIRQGADFQEVAREMSRDPSAGLGGFQGEFSRRDLPRAFADPLFRLRDGEVSDVLQAEYGFHLFQVVRRYPAELAEPAEVREEILARLRQQATDRAMAALLAEARQRFPVRVFPHNFPFNYEGFYRHATPQKAV